jgi:hypothetical protein
MESFVKYYYLNEKFTDDLRRAFTKNIFTKSTIGVNVDRLNSFAKVDEKTFDRVSEALRRDMKIMADSISKFYKGKSSKTFSLETALKNEKLRRKILKELGPIYVKKLYNGEIDDDAEKMENFKDVLAVSVYELNNGAQIILFTVETDNGTIDRYIGINKDKANKYFTQSVGQTFQQIMANAKAKLPKQKPVKATQSSIFTTRDIENDVLGLGGSSKTIETPEEDEQEVGVMDINLDEMEMLKKIWGTGYKGGSLVRGGEYPFSNKFVRSRYSHPTLKYLGYKYSDDKGHAVYLLDTRDDKNAMIVFKDRASYDWVDGIGMLDYWRGTESPKDFSWVPGTIKTLT